LPHVTIARSFFDAVQAGDTDRARALCADDFELVQNGGPPISADALMGTTRRLLDRIPDFRYEDCVTAATEGGFVEEHHVRGTLPDGTELDLAVCVVADVVDGRIRHAREYLDGYAARALGKVLG
jgi:ketosteroid isomerase-like protein